MRLIGIFLLSAIALTNLELSFCCCSFENNHNEDSLSSSDCCFSIPKESTDNLIDDLLECECSPQINNEIIIVTSNLNFTSIDSIHFSDSYLIRDEKNKVKKTCYFVKPPLVSSVRLHILYSSYLL